MPSADSSRITKQPYGYSCLLQDILEVSWGKAHYFPCTAARSTLQLLSGYGLRGDVPTRPNCTASYLVSVRQLTSLLHASFRPYLTVTPLRFTSPSPPLGWAEDLHLLVVYHAQHTRPPTPEGMGFPIYYRLSCTYPKACRPWGSLGNITHDTL